MFTAVLLIRSPISKQHEITVTWISKQWSVPNQNSAQQLKKITVDDMKKYRWNLAALFWVKEARRKWMHFGWVHLFENLTRTESCYGKGETNFEMMIIFCILIVVVIFQMQQLIKICRNIVYSLETFIGSIK